MVVVVADAVVRSKDDVALLLTNYLTTTTPTEDGDPAPWWHAKKPRGAFCLSFAVVQPACNPTWVGQDVCKSSSARCSHLIA